MNNSNSKNNRLSFQAYDELINSSRSISRNSSFMSTQKNAIADIDMIEELDQNDHLLKTRNAQTQKNFTKRLIQERKLSSQAQILKAFNTIRDMNNKEQINQALLMIPNVKDRIMLVEKLLERREQIAKAKEMQAINNLAPLFNKIKLKFLNSLQKQNIIKSDRLQKFKTVSLGPQNPNQAVTNNLTTNTQQQGDTQNNQIKNKTLIRKSSVQNLSPTQNKHADSQKEDENMNQIQQQNKNIMGAITIFATHDIKIDKEKEEIDKKIKHNKLLGYLQKDNFLRTSIVAQEDRLKSPTKNNGNNQNSNQKSSNNLASNDCINGNSIQSQNSKKKQEKNAQQSKQVNQEEEENEQDYTQKMQALKKKMYLVNYGVGRRDSPSSSSNKHSRKKSLNLSPASQFNYQNQDFIKEDSTQKYFFKPQLNSFSQATSNFQSQNLNMQNRSCQSINSTKKSHLRKSAQSSIGGNGVLFDFIMECEQKRFLSKNYFPDIDDKQTILRKIHSSQSSIQQNNKIPTIPNLTYQIKQNPESSTQLLHKIFQMQKHHSATSNKVYCPQVKHHHLKSQSISFNNQVNQH